MSEVLPHPLKPEGPPQPAGKHAVRPKSAATLILIRRDGPKPRVLMGRRHSGHSFMPDRWVFPGGRVDRADYHPPAAADLAPEVQAIFDAHLKPRRGRAVALAAVRECFEEAGLLLARPAPPRPGAGPWRDFLAQGALPDLSALDIVARAITPSAVAKRFDAWFLMAEAERLLSLERQPDCGELEEIAWFDFDEARALKLPNVTGAVLAETEARLADPDRPRPFFRRGASAGVWDRL
jgi:8-oxo-dGTP pyrophosphatase MutT (NUDIX family)